MAKSNPLAALMGDEKSDPMEDADPELDAAKDIIKAVRADDPEALNLSLKRHYELCQDTDEDEEESPESGKYDMKE